MIPRSGFDAASNSTTAHGGLGARHSAASAEELERPSWPGMLAVLLLALAGAFAAAWLAIENGIENQRQELSELLHRAARTLARDTASSSAIGAAIVMGLNEPMFKDAVRGLREPDAPEVLGRLAVARERFGAESALLIAADGVVVAHQGAEPISATGINLAYRPYLAQALLGVESIYGALGAATGERSLIFSAPLYEGVSTTGQVIGALLLRMPLAPIERTLFAPGQDWLLLSPQGVVFLSNRADWLFAVAPSVDPAQLAQIRAGRQFGPTWSGTSPPVLPFDPVRREAQLAGTRFIVDREPVDWNDPGGRWQLVALKNASVAVPLSEPIGFGAAAFVTIAMFGLLLQSQIRNRRRNATTVARCQTLGAALERSATAVVVTDARGTIEWVNPQFERNSLYSLAEVRGKSVEMLFGERTPAEVRRELSAALRHGRPWCGEFLNRRKDGSRYSERVSLSPVLGADGKCVGVVGLHEDITDTTQAQNDLARRETLACSVLESSPDAILSIDAKGTILSANREAESMFGHPRAVLVGGSVAMLLPARFHAALAAGHEPFAVALDHATDSHRPALFGLRKSGEEFPIDLKIAQLRDGQAERFVASVRDTTLRGATERRLTELLAQQNAILDHAPPIVLACDGLFRKVNPAFAEMFGHAAESLVGRPTSILFESPKDHAAFSAQVAPALERDEPVCTEWRLRRADGHTIVARIRGRAVPIEGAAPGAVWVIEALSGVARPASARKIA